MLETLYFENGTILNCEWMEMRVDFMPSCLTAVRSIAMSFGKLQSK